MDMWRFSASSVVWKCWTCNGTSSCKHSSRTNISSRTDSSPRRWKLQCAASQVYPIARSRRNKATESAPPLSVTSILSSRVKSFSWSMYCAIFFLFIIVLSSYCAIINSAKRCLQNLQASTIMHLSFIYLPNIHLTVRLHNLQPLSDLHQRLSLRS